LVLVLQLVPRALIQLFQLSLQLVVALVTESLRELLVMVVLVVVE
jgi:hypothetical protein